jgi:SPOR domain
LADDLSIPRPGIRTTTTTVRPGRYGAGQRTARPGMDPDVRRMALFAGGLGSVLAVLIGISALTGRHSGEVPVVAADERPIRVKPADPGGMKINAAENDVFSGGSDTTKARLGPAPESPDRAALNTAAAETQSAAETPSSASPPAPAAQAAPKASSASAPQTAPKASPAPAAQTAPKAPPAPGAQSTPKAPPAAASKPVVATQAAATSAPAAHSATVQLAALTSEQAAHAEWQALVKRMPDLLASHQPSFSRVEHDGHAFWRVRTSGFADVAQARGFCEKVRAKGGGCSVTEF